MKHKRHNLADMSVDQKRRALIRRATTESNQRFTIGGQVRKRKRFTGSFPVLKCLQDANG